jgi:hypothetical protein
MSANIGWRAGKKTMTVAYRESLSAKFQKQMGCLPHVAERRFNP